MSEILSHIENARPRLQSGTGFGERSVWYMRCKPVNKYIVPQSFVAVNRRRKRKWRKE